ncbi:hypothetical protein GGR50DRAFT_641390 [Xylaria sp. CBS 124048]|nr:hypothetical protein GGR50DRAFT_641390 [Xylaria sp. CBS 124048]
MGIQGLLPLLKSIQRPTELKKFSGETFGIDAYGWLHRGAVSCAIELAQGKPTQKYVDFAMSRARMVRHFGVTPYFVFDGDLLPSKAATEASRLKRREEARKMGLELLKAGKPAQAHQELQKAIDVTPEMARHLIEALKKADIPYVVAPYEADAQLVYLERQGIISGIISEDSDLLVFGAKRLITKLDKYGSCVEVNRRDFNACREVSFIGWDDKQFRQMAILSGCDYLDSIPNMGLKTAHRMLRKDKTVERIIRKLQFEGKHRIPADYLMQFQQAEQTFLYQWAFCPTAKQLVNLNTLPSDLTAEQLPFIGSFVEQELAQRIACGDVNPITKQKIVLPVPSSPRKRTASAAHRNSIAQSQNQDTPKKPIDSYFKDHGRRPLAEMDPNCFHVNPDRVTSEGVAPIVFPLPRPYIDEAESAVSGPTRTYINNRGDAARVMRRRTEPVTNLLSNNGRTLASSSRRSITASDTRVSHTVDNNTTGINPRPPKKARLCDDAVSRLSPGKGKSKFFSPNCPKVKRVTNGEGYLMSDDSIEEALKDLPDVEGWPEPSDRRKTISVFEGHCSGAAKLDDSKDDSQDGSKDDEKEGLSKVAGLAAAIPNTTPKSILGRFSYTPGALPRVSSQQQQQQFAKSLRRQSSISSARSSQIFPTPVSSAPSQPSSAMTTPATTPRLTPLQQIERQALSRCKESPSSRFATTRAPKRSSLGRMSLDSIPINPAFVPLPPADVAKLEVPNRSVGSEDLFAPESEAEEQEAGSTLNKMNSTKKGMDYRAMDLSQYMFSFN